MDWNILLSAIVGGLLAVIPVLITIRNQSKERDEERQEQRREAKTQLALELMSRDIRIIEDAIDNDLKALDIYSGFRLKKEAGKITEDEMREQIKLITLDESSRVSLLGETLSIAEKLACSLGDDFYREYRDYQNATSGFLDYYVNSPTYNLEDMERIDSRVYKSAAKLHNILKDKLISIRDA